MTGLRCLVFVRGMLKMGNLVKVAACREQNDVDEVKRTRGNCPGRKRILREVVQVVVRFRDAAAPKPETAHDRRGARSHDHT